MGTVIYLPDRDPIEPFEMKAMMCGGKAPVTSRMDFGYDFILKTIQSGNRSWLDLLEKSYWRRQREVIVKQIKADQLQLDQRKAALVLTEEEVKAFNEKAELESQIANFTNAKRKKAELALSRWKDVHTGAKWSIAETKSNELRSLNQKLKILENDLATATNVSCDVEARIRVLEAAGFLTPLEDPKAHTKESLTTKGILATELNESDALLVSQLYLFDDYRNMEAKEILAVLASCILEGKKKDEEPTLDELSIPQKVKDALLKMNDFWNDLTRIEKEKKSHYTEWSLGTFWIEPLWRWMEGESVATLCTDYGLYEGNLIRSVLKLQNMLEEWRSMATYCQHTEVLTRLEGADSLIIREAVIQDSLYLHL